MFSSLTHLQANGQVKTMNKIIKGNIKVKLEKLKGASVNDYHIFSNHIEQQQESLRYNVEAIN